MAEVQNLLRLTAQIVAAHLARNPVGPDGLPQLIEEVYASLMGAGVAPPVAAQEPAVAIRRSVFPDHIVCLEDGKKLQTMKRHLQTDHRMTPEQYREKWNLPASYPMTAPDYTARRSELAKTFGLGLKGRGATSSKEPVGEPMVQKIPARRARGSKG